MCRRENQRKKAGGNNYRQQPQQDRNPKRDISEEKMA